MRPCALSRLPVRHHVTGAMSQGLALVAIPGDRLGGARFVHGADGYGGFATHSGRWQDSTLYRLISTSGNLAGAKTVVRGRACAWQFWTTSTMPMKQRMESSDCAAAPMSRYSLDLSAILLRF